jgi:hypothetical protein
MLPQLAVCHEVVSLYLVLLALIDHRILYLSQLSLFFAQRLLSGIFKLLLDVDPLPEPLEGRLS